MNMLDIEDRFYTSTEVADILGVSLRSIYRYLEEGKIKAEVKTATGRHRFTKQNILDFLKPQADRVPEEKPAAPVADSAPAAAVVAPAEEEASEELTEEESAELEASAEPIEDDVSADKKDSVDWLEKFKEAAAKHRAEQETSDADAEEEVEEETADEETPAADEVETEEEKVEAVSGLATEAPTQEEEKAEEETPYNYYKSAIGGLKDIAQNLDKSAKKASLEYAFTMNAGLSLHKPIKPFSLLHSYVRTQDKDFFEKVLKLSSSTKESAQLCLIVSDEEPIYESRKELHGLYVVSDVKLRADLMAIGEEELAKELE